MHQITDLFSLKINIKLGTVVYSIHQNETVPNYTNYFNDEVIINIHSSDFFNTAKKCMKHAKKYNAVLIYILTGECIFNIKPEEICDVYKLKEQFNILSLNNNSDNDCFMLTNKALSLIDTLDYSFLSWIDLTKKVNQMISVGKLSDDILVSNKDIKTKIVETIEEIVEEHTEDFDNIIQEPKEIIVEDLKELHIIEQKEIIENPELKDTNYKLWIYTLCYNEKKIIPFVIKYWKEYAHKVIVYDNGSDDGSIEELFKYDWIEIRHFDSDGLNDLINMELKNKCWQEAKNKNVDFVLVCDFDEVLWANNIRQELVKFKNSSTGIWNSKCYEICTKEFPHNNYIFVHDNSDAVCTFSSNMSKKILFKPDCIDNMNYTPGCHSYKAIGECVTLYNNENIKMFHLKHLSVNYLLLKFHNGAKRLSELNRNKGYGFQYNDSDTKIIDNFNRVYNKGKVINSEKNKIAVCAIAKMENHYIREWVEHHKKLRFDNIILYDNNDVDSERFEEVIDDYIKEGYVIIENYRGKVSNQLYGKDYDSVLGTAYKECYKKYYKLFSWICYIDIDEFVFTNNTNIYEILNNQLYDNLNGVRIYWKLYGDNNLIYYENKPVLLRFDCEDNSFIDVDCFFKTFVKTNINPKNILFNAHGPIDINLNIPDINMKPVSNSMKGNTFGNPIIFIKHFYTKSTEEFFTRKYKKTSCVCGHKSPRNYKKSYLIDSNKHNWGYFKTNEKTDEKMKFINEFCNKKDRE